ncbi:hypothetical protein J2Z83_003887 [Virgibacillus natechei]|uniref:Restriction endonuclease type IV Mrr domain-containing protein n=1 Tax=Virgibacillus natechei TaxID=1216297 RepID=A0ABS4IL89_9BACI|nr:hypothetical protein [Virgibacillus natechei]MBP1971732.1 hypothetical protein [Virgibacillus natechei]UZD12274.1 hypothetical protein OLD84_15275 [Virgibacillus natechei]
MDDDILQVIRALRDGFRKKKITNKISGRKLELHLGIEVNGRSSVGHEIDISIIECKQANDARNKGKGFNVTGFDIPLTIECKNYNKENLTKQIGREWLGVCFDTERGVNQNFHRIGMFVTSSNSSDVKTLLAAYNIFYFGNMTKSSEINNFTYTFNSLLQYFK